jgi:protein-S-isoprenylcysteine O-methyltransferase Ste14
VKSPTPQKWPRHALNAAFIWYLVMMAFHGTALSAMALVQALGLSLIVGTLLTGNALGGAPLRRRQIARFYLIPFCVSSFTAATAPSGFIVIFSPSLVENGLAALLAATPLLRLHRLPPFWFLLAVLAQFALAWHGPAGSVSVGLSLLGWLLLIGGIALVLTAAQRFQKWRTPIKPFQQPEHCITDGIFRYSRNPLYLGEVIMLLGLAALLGTWLALLPIPVFMAVIQLVFIQPEERLLQEHFGSAYQSYRHRVRRWV